MAYLCKYCQKPFSRSDNRDRHEKQSCRLAYRTEDQPEQQENMLPYSLPPSPSVDECSYHCARCADLILRHKFLSRD